MALIAEQSIIICTDQCSKEHLLLQEGKDHFNILWFPVFGIIKFLFYFGWLRVAQTLYNPFGEDDDDFELNELIDRHFSVAMEVVDQAGEPPQLQKDIFWDQEDKSKTVGPTTDANGLKTEVTANSHVKNCVVKMEVDDSDNDERRKISKTETRDPMMPWYTTHC